MGGTMDLTGRHLGITALDRSRHGVRIEAERCHLRWIKLDEDFLVWFPGE